MGTHAWSMNGTVFTHLVSHLTITNHLICKCRLVLSPWWKSISYCSPKRYQLAIFHKLFTYKFEI